MSLLEQQLYQHHADMCRVFSHPKRLEIINTLRGGEMSVGDLAHTLKISTANASQHLAMMRERQILAIRRSGTTVFYRVANPKLLRAFDILREILEENIAKTGALI